MITRLNSEEVERGSRFNFNYKLLTFNSFGVGKPFLHLP